MAQIIVRGIPEEDMTAVTERASRLGRSCEEEVRRLIARAADEERGWGKHVWRAEDWQSRLAGRVFADSTERVRQDRDSR